MSSFIQHLQAAAKKLERTNRIYTSNIHPHKLQLLTTRSARCDSCGLDISKSSPVYTCPPCDFDICSSCFDKTTISKQDSLPENALSSTLTIHQSSNPQTTPTPSHSSISRVSHNSLTPMAVVSAFQPVVARLQDSITSRTAHLTARRQGIPQAQSSSDMALTHTLGVPAAVAQAETLVAQLREELAKERVQVVGTIPDAVWARVKAERDARRGRMLHSFPQDTVPQAPIPPPTSPSGATWQPRSKMLAILQAQRRRILEERDALRRIVQDQLPHLRTSSLSSQAPPDTGPPPSHSPSVTQPEAAPSTPQYGPDSQCDTPTPTPEASRQPSSHSSNTETSDVSATYTCPNTACNAHIDTLGRRLAAARSRNKALTARIRSLRSRIEEGQQRQRAEAARTAAREAALRSEILELRTDLHAARDRAREAEAAAASALRLAEERALALDRLTAEVSALREALSMQSHSCPHPDTPIGTNGPPSVPSLVPHSEVPAPPSPSECRCGAAEALAAERLRVSTLRRLVRNLEAQLESAHGVHALPTSAPSHDFAQAQGPNHSPPHVPPPAIPSGLSPSEVEYLRALFVRFFQMPNVSLRRTVARALGSVLKLSPADMAAILHRVT